MDTSVTIDLSAPLSGLLSAVRLNGEPPCKEAAEWAKQFSTASAAWEECQRPDWMLWSLKALGLNDDRKDRLFACWCVRNTPLQDGRTTWNLLTDERSRSAVVVAERFANGEASQEELAAASVAAWGAVWDAVWDAARAAARDAAWAAAWAAARDAASAATRAATWAATWAAAWDASKFQADALRSICGDPFRQEQQP